MSVNDIDGAQPKKLNRLRGKKQGDFFDNDKLNQIYNKKKSSTETAASLQHNNGDSSLFL